MRGDQTEVCSPLNCLQASHTKLRWDVEFQNILTWLTSPIVSPLSVFFFPFFSKPFIQVVIDRVRTDLAGESCQLIIIMLECD